MKIIESNADLPPCLNTPSKQKRTAKRLAAFVCSQPIRTVREADLQGFFSRTWIVAFDSAFDRVIQFRVEPINLEDFHGARRVLGDYVPHIAKIDDATLTEANIYPYVMSVIPGITWLRARNRIANADVTACKSLGRILALGSVGLNSAVVVDDFVKPKLRALLGCEDKLVTPYRSLIEKLLHKADNLKGLPLFVAHADLNHVNIHVDDNGEVTGIVDWEGACRLPFGMGFSRIPHLAGGFRNGKFYVPKTFEEAERGLWSELINQLPSEVSDILASKMEVVQMSLTVGTLLEDLDSEHGRSDIILSNLPMLLKYRIPAIRGEELAFE